MSTAHRQRDADGWASRQGAGSAEGAACDCSTDPAPAGWPPLQVLVLFPTREPGAAPAFQRAAARRFARRVLLQRAGAATATRWLGLPRGARGAQGVSFSHEADASLLAWCPTGEIGVDLVDLDSLALASPRELVATAALYLGPDWASEVAARTLASGSHIHFALGWASLEARLKCLGMGLDEWQPARDQRLSKTGVVKIRVMECDGQTSKRWIGCVAWRDETETCASDNCLIRLSIQSK